MKVSDAMTPEVQLCTPDDTLKTADLVAFVTGAEVGALERFQLVDLALVGAVERGRQGHFQLAPRDHGLQITRRLLVILDHGGGKGFLGGVAPLPRELAGLDLEHVADGGLFHEIFRRRADAKGRVYSGLSPTDWAVAGVASRTSARHGARYFIFLASLPYCSRLTPVALVSISNRAYRFLYRFDPNGPARTRWLLFELFFSKPRVRDRTDDNPVAG